MAQVIGIRFKQGGKIYYFSPNEEEFEVGSHAIVETVHGTECGEVVMGRREIDDSTLSHELKTVIRRATNEDLMHVESNKRKAERAFEICNEKIKAHGLDMNLLDVEYTFDNNKILFSFSAEGRVDFRELVKDLAGAFRARIELRQIGVRDEAKMLGGLGVCGRPFCCKQFMGDFQSVSIKMAKEQGLSLNPVKISGTCGRLMCCLKHEQEAYEALIRETPRIGSSVVTPDGTGTVVEQELIAGKVKVRLDFAPEAPAKAYRVADLKRSDKAGEVQMSDEEYINSIHSKYDIPETEDEMEMLSELEELEGSEQPQHNKRKPKQGGNNNGGGHRGGKPHGERESKPHREPHEDRNANHEQQEQRPHREPKPHRDPKPHREPKEHGDRPPQNHNHHNGGNNGGGNNSNKKSNPQKPHGNRPHHEKPRGERPAGDKHSHNQHKPNNENQKG